MELITYTFNTLRNRLELTTRTPVVRPVYHYYTGCTILDGRFSGRFLKEPTFRQTSAYAYDRLTCISSVDLMVCSLPPPIIIFFDCVMCFIRF